jgi:hypothetical protein
VGWRHGPRGSPHTALVIAQVVLEPLGVPADGPTAAVGVVAVGPGQAVAVGQAHGRAVAGDVLGIAFNAQAATITAQVAAAEASGQAAGGPAVGGRSGRTGGSVAGRMPALRTARTAGGPDELHQTVGRGLEPRHEAATGGPAGMPALWGWAGAGPGRAGGDVEAVGPGQAVAVGQAPGRAFAGVIGALLSIPKR